MTRARALVVSSGLSFGLSLGLFSLSAAAMPPVVERIPDDAMMVVTIPNPATMEKNLGALNAAIESPMPVPSLKDMLTMGGLGAGIDTTRSMAMVVFAPTPEEVKARAEKIKKAADMGEEPDLEVLQAEEKVVVLLPVTNYAEFIAGFGAEKPAGEGKVDAITMSGGQSGFAKDLGGGYAVIGEKQDLVQKYTGKAGPKPMGTRIGKAGEQLADASDVVVLFNMEQVRPLVPQAIAEMRESAKRQAEAMGADAATAEKNVAAAIWMMESISRDATGMVGGLKFSGAGVAGDMNANFSEGSLFAKAFAAGGKPGSLLGKLPSQAFLFAGAMDFSNPDVKQIFKEIASRSPNPTGEQSMIAGIENAKGMAAIMGFPMGGAIAGLLTSTVTYSDVADPAVAIATAKATMMAMDGKTEQGITYKVTYADGGAKVGTTPVDVWDMKMSMGENDEAQMAAQGMAFIFGPQGGPGGYIAKSQTGVYTTFAKNSELMGKALAAGNGEGERLDGDAMLKETAGNLPSGRIAEAYIGTKSIMDLALPFVGMFGVQVPMDKIPAQLPPIGMAIASDHGQARFSMFVPASVIKTTTAVGQDLMQQLEGLGGEPMGENPDDKKDGEGKSGQPRF